MWVFWQERLFVPASFRKKRIMEEISKKGKNKKTIFIGITLICVIGLAVVLGIMLKDYIRENKNQKYYEELAKNTTQTEASDTEIETETETEEPKDILTQLGITIPEKQIDWNALYEENEDIYAWIYIPGTVIDYPIVQHPTNNDYYVNHNLDGSSGRPAAIMTQNYNTKTFLDYNTLVYGHKMRNGTMFRDLHEFESEDFFAQNRYVYIYLPETVYVYEIFAEYTFGNELITVCYDFSSQQGFQEYLDVVSSYKEKNGQFRDGMNITTDNHLLTLSTCTTPTDYNYRYLVQGVLVNDPTLTDDEIIRTVRSIQ